MARGSPSGLRKVRVMAQGTRCNRATKMSAMLRIYMGLSQNMFDPPKIERSWPREAAPKQIAVTKTHALPWALARHPVALWPLGVPLIEHTLVGHTAIGKLNGNHFCGDPPISRHPSLFFFPTPVLGSFYATTKRYRESKQGPANEAVASGFPLKPPK